MTDHDIAELRGQVFGTQIVLSICLAKICEIMERPNEFLDDIQKSLIPKMKDAAPAFAQNGGLPPGPGRLRP